MISFSIVAIFLLASFYANKIVLSISDILLDVSALIFEILF